MAHLVQYRQIIQKILSDYRDWLAGANQIGIQNFVSFDQENDHYFLFHVGWNDKQRDFGVTVYIRLDRDKIWIEEDWSKQGIANDLLEAGVPPEDIVLGFQHPSKRPLTEFAIA
jgi:hypothetical protein